MANPNFAEHFYYGWIGVRIDNEADATGTVMGWAYEDTPGMSILAGDTGPVVANGDFNGDNEVDGADFLIWQRQNGTSVTPYTGADGNGDGTVDDQDLALWQGDFGTSVATAPLTAAVPEPPSLAISVFTSMLLASCVLVNAWRRRKLASGR